MKISKNKQTCSLRQIELEQSLEKVQKELEQIKEQLNHHKQLADSASRQRDMYRILLQTAGVELPPQSEYLRFRQNGLSVFAFYP